MPIHLLPLELEARSTMHKMGAQMSAKLIGEGRKIELDLLGEASSLFMGCAFI